MKVEYDNEEMTNVGQFGCNSESRVNLIKCSLINNILIRWKVQIMK